MAACPSPRAASGRNAGPKLLYELMLDMRSAEPGKLTERTRQLAVTVFEDPDADSLLYLTHTGSFAVAANVFRESDKHGAELKNSLNARSRKGGETRTYGIEVFVDSRTGHRIFISETGSIAVLAK
jgi:hypothetical protein